MDLNEFIEKWDQTVDIPEKSGKLVKIRTNTNFYVQEQVFYNLDLTYKKSKVLVCCYDSREAQIKFGFETIGMFLETYGFYYKVLIKEQIFFVKADAVTFL